MREGNGQDGTSPAFAPSCRLSKKSFARVRVRLNDSNFPWRSDLFCATNKLRVVPSNQGNAGVEVNNMTSPKVLFSFVPTNSSRRCGLVLLLMMISQELQGADDSCIRRTEEGSRRTTRGSCCHVAAACRNILVVVVVSIFI